MNTKKQTWATIEEANNYFSKTEKKIRWNKISEKDKQQILNKSLKLIIESDLYVFPDEPKQNMKEAQCEQALKFFLYRESEKLFFEYALHPIAKEKLKLYKKSDLAKKTINTTDWDVAKDRNQLIEGRFNFGEYELISSLIYIRIVQDAQNKLFKIELKEKIIDRLQETKMMWKNQSEKYPSSKALHKFWPREIPKIDTRIDDIIYKNLDEIIEELKSSKENKKIDPKSFYIKPQNLIVLTWAKAFKSKERIYWKIILETLNSIYRKIKKTDLGDVFDEIDKDKIFKNQETLRQIHIKHTNLNYYDKKKHKARMALIDSIYKKSFIEKKTVQIN